MTQAWQDCWTFRIVDQETGAAVTGVPVTVLPEGKSEGGYWVSDADGLVRVPKHDHARLRLRVGLRNEETIELDARSLPDDPVPLTAPHGVPTAGPESAPRADRSSPEIAAALSPPPGHLIRFARLVVLAEDQDVAATPDPSAIGAAESPEPTSIRYGAVLEVDQVWQAQGPQPGDVFYSVSLGPGEEVKLVVSDGRWRKKPDARERPLQIVSRMVAARQLADAVDAVPLEPAVTSDLGGAASERALQVLELGESP